MPTGRVFFFTLFSQIEHTMNTFFVYYKTCKQQMNAPETPGRMEVIMTYTKLIQHDVLESRHDLTRLLKLDMYELKTAEEHELINFYAGRMYGMVAAYWQMGIIDMCARVRYINIISANVINTHRRLLYE